MDKTQTEQSDAEKAARDARKIVDQWMSNIENGSRVDSPFSRTILARQIISELADKGWLTAVKPVVVEAEELAEQISVGVHTGLRKGSEAESSADLWKAISKSDDSAWSDAATFCAHGLLSMGYTVTRDPE